MGNQVYAVLVVKAHEQAILSEAGIHFDRPFLEAWIEKHGPGGFFIREPSEPDKENHPLDNQLLTSDQFHQLFEFENGDPEVMFRRVRKK